MRSAFATLRALFAAEEHKPHVHFHRGPDGRPAVCDHDRCSSPHLSLD